MPRVWCAYWRIKQELLRLWAMRAFAYDALGTYRAMFWVPESTDRHTLAASLLFQYHKLEKGLSMPGPRRLFGVDPAGETMRLLRRWERAGHSKANPVYLGALETLRGYALHLETYALDGEKRIAADVTGFLVRHQIRDPKLSTPVGLAQIDAPDSARAAFRSLVAARRSVRDFSPERVPHDLVHSAVQLAQQSPSACNRQPCSVHVVTDADLKASLLAYQNGNRGFGDRIPTLLIITADERCFFDASERHQPYIDGGLFAMTLCYALTAEGLASCCLNWCVPPANDRVVHRLARISSSERIIMFMAVGYAQKGCVVPRSPRRAVDEVLQPVPSGGAAPAAAATA